MDAPAGDDWVALVDGPLAAAEALAWSVLPGTGAQVVFTGTVRDHAEGRSDVVAVTYEAYEEQVVPRLEALAADVRRRWPDVARIALWHRHGRLVVGEMSVVVAVSAPHRADAFAAAQHAIDTLKVTLPVWKEESWAGGSGWGTNAAPVEEVAR